MSFTVIDLSDPDTETEPELVTYYLLGVRCQQCVTGLQQYLITVVSPLTEAHFQFIQSHQALQVSFPANYSQTQLQHLVTEYGDYTVTTVLPTETTTETVATTQPTPGWLNYLGELAPLWLIITYLTVAALLYGKSHHYSWMSTMQIWMGLFYLVFSFFKLLNLRGFVKGFQRYDWLAIWVPVYAYLYPALEIILGMAYLYQYRLHLANIVTVAVFTENLLGVGWAQYQGKQLECACLGSVLQLPLGTVTLLEDLTMIAMGVIGLCY